MVLLTAFVTLAAFATVIYSSCKKDPCSGVTCQNGGACNGGSCTCLSGYSGSRCENSTITFTNDSYTTVNITVNGSSATIAAGNSLSFTGGAGSTANVTATTAAYSSTGVQIGDLVSWSFSDNFPTGGDLLTDPLDVPNTYFYLYLINTLPSYINSVALNSQVTDYVAVPNDGYTYGVGYYFTQSGYANLYVTTTGGGSYNYYPIYVPGGYNSSVTFNAK